MFKEFFSFEIRYQLRQPLFYVCTLIFFLLTFGAITSDEITIGGAIGNVHRNAPFVIMQILLVMSVIGVFTTTAFVANSTYRDVEYNTQSLFFSSPISKAGYLLGRFSGATVVAFAVFLGVVLAIIIGSWMPWIEADRIGPFQWGPYLFSMFMLVLPNLLLTGGIFFSLAAKSRSMLYTYAGVVAFFVAYAISGVLLRDVQNETVASLLDPFGFAAFSFATRYWTVFEKNNSILPLNGVLVYNRLLWVGVSAAILMITFWRYRFAVGARGGKRKKQVTEEALPEKRNNVTVLPAATHQDFSRSAAWRQYLWGTKLEFIGVLKSVPFLVILALGAFNVMGSASGTDDLFGTPVYPVTNMMLRVISGSFFLFLFLIQTFYSGELTWKERSLNLNGVTDALPVRDWIPWASKLTALIGIQYVATIVAILTAIGIQAYHGYHNFELGLYLRAEFLQSGVLFMQVSILALFLQAVINNKYVGFMLMIVYFISLIALPNMHFEHNLYRYGNAPDWTYSDMNGFGHYVKPLFWFGLYWSFIAVILVAVTHLFWIRGTETSFRLRMRIARERFHAGTRTALAIGVIGTLLTGGYIFYNTNILNEYITQDQVEKRQAEFEKLYKTYEGMPLPRITDVKADVDIYPEQRSVNIRGTYLLKNKLQQPINVIHLTLNRIVKIHKINVPDGSLQMKDPEHGYYIYKLSKPMNPGDAKVISYDLSVENRGFVNGRSNTKLVYNGTFFDSSDYFPHLGYSREFQLQDKNKRKKYGLPPVERMPDLDNAAARMHTFFTPEADWINFETTVSTSSDQIAIAPGYLQKEWVQNGRRYFYYKMDSPILDFWSYLSARYEVKRDHWHDVAIEIYYHPAHPYNVQRMIDAVKMSLDYCSQNFSPYQHRQVRIIEFPRYAMFAQSFPNTIPYSESLGFIARIEKPDDIDYVYYVTAHEIAHQWWAHQVIGGNVQGATMLDETMAQYSALMVMEKKYGPSQMRKFLKYELDRYLQGRGGELVQELPLMRVEEQGYIHYSKGSLVTYALRDYVGEQPLNAALSKYVHATAFQNPPFTYTREFLQYVSATVPESKKSILHDLFETITLYDLKTTDVSSTKQSDGKYLVKMTVEAKKFRSDGQGKETSAAINDWIDIGVLGEKKNGIENVLALQKKQINSGAMHFEFVVNQPPKKAGIDPLNKLIDRNPDDNTKDIS